MRRHLREVAYLRDRRAIVRQLKNVSVRMVLFLSLDAGTDGIRAKTGPTLLSLHALGSLA